MSTSTTKCAKCKLDILLENAMLLHWCTKETVVSTNEIVAEAKPLLCNNCTYTCDRCKVGGCSECIKTECCDCSIQLCHVCSDVDDLMCDCFGKCYTCGTDVSRGSGWPCGECGIWNCSDCKKRDNNPCKECGPPPKSESEKEKEKEPEKEKTTFNCDPVFKCESCEKVHPLEKAIRCTLCNINDESASETEDEDDSSATVASLEDTKSVDSWDGKIKHLFCKKCTLKCDACEERGCRECVEFVCCDCGYNMCYECRNNEVDCGCYGECYSCGVDIDRGSDGWPCGECEKWYCRGCRDCDNPCKECGPESEEESDASLEEDEENDLKISSN